MATTPSTSDYLLVPMNVQGVIYNNQMGDGPAYYLNQMNYANLAQFRSPAPPLFSNPTESIAHGVYVHWDLPAAFKHGQQQQDNTIDFPHAPNRWMVLRFWPGGGADTRQVKAWIIISDYVDVPVVSTNGASPFVYPYDGANSGKPTYLGRNYNLQEWPGESTPMGMFLKAVGPGDVSFAAFRPNVNGVFSFYDDCTDNSGTALTTPVDLTYLIVGWYTDETYDPLNALAYPVAGVDQSAKTFTIVGEGDPSDQFISGKTFTVTDSTDNDAAYTIASASYDAASDTLTLTVTGSIPSSTADGFILAAEMTPAAWATRLGKLGWLTTPAPYPSPPSISRGNRSRCRDTAISRAASAKAAPSPSPAARATMAPTRLPRRAIRVRTTPSPSS